jgi:FKBP-type peptidyl-prolyl cis-trans isomerase 2
MIINDLTVVSVNYKLSNHVTGEKIEETTTENPMVFLFGVGSIISSSFSVGVIGADVIFKL